MNSKPNGVGCCFAHFSKSAQGCMAAWGGQMLCARALTMGAKNRWRNKDRDRPEIEALKIDLCRKLYWIMIYDRKTTRFYAAHLGTSVATISRIKNQKTTELSLDQLFFFMAQLRPGFKFLIATE